MNRWVFRLLTVFLFIGAFACNNDYVPKPRGYFRIELPEKEYRSFDSIYPFTFNYPEYALVSKSKYFESDTIWLNVVFPELKGTVHLTYEPVNENLAKYLKDSREFVNKHIPKANAIDQKLFINEANKVYGIIYDIEGTGAASPCQFFLTDSVNHFLRGALYFSVEPNNDSLQPVIDFVREDIIEMINSFDWKEEE
jgi:gliding motility-associated lipoprotein GldD